MEGLSSTAEPQLTKINWSSYDSESQLGSWFALRVVSQLKPLRMGEY